MTTVPAAMLLASIAAIPTGNDAWRLADADAKTLPQEIRYCTRYVWIKDGDPITARAVSLTWNYVSRSALPYRPTPLGRDNLLVLRFDLRRTAPREGDLKDHLRLWEEFRFDPLFSRLFTKDTLKFNALVVLPTTKHWVEKKCAPYVHEDGNTYNTRWTLEEAPITQEEIAKLDVVRVPGESLDPHLVHELTGLLGTEAPIVSSPYFVVRSLSSIKNKGLYKELYGGLYYDLVGYKQGVKGKIDLDGIFASIGLQNVDKLFDDLRSDQKIAIFRSNVTGKPRAVTIFHSPANRTGTGTVRISSDLKDESIDIGTHPMMNLLKFKFDGQELIFERANGLHGFAALNGDGKLVEEVPFDIALDTTIPGPHSRRLQAAMSCIVCHGPQDGVQPLKNDAKSLLNLGPLNVLGDQTRRDQFDANDRIAGLYAGDPTKLLYRVKDDYASAVLFTTGPWPGSKEGQTDIVRLASAKLGEIRKAYWYDQVGPEQVLIDNGIEPGKEPLKTLREAVLLNPGPVGLEDVRIGALLKGIPLNRFEYDQIFDFLAVRVRRVPDNAQEQGGKK